MGKKINPRILRINTTGSTMSKWFASKQAFAGYLEEDVRIRKMIRTSLSNAGVSSVEIKRSREEITILIRTSKPGMIIGRGGAGIEDLKKRIKKQFFGSQRIKITMEVEEVRTPETDAELILQNIAYQVEKRVPFRRAMKRAVEAATEAGAKGVKVVLSGRLNGVDIARTETVVDGSIPTHTLRANIDYSRGVARTIYGAIGIKVWVYKGLVFGDGSDEKEEPRSRNNRRRRNGGRNSGGGNRSRGGRSVKKSNRSENRTIVKGKKTEEKAAKPEAKETKNAETASDAKETKAEKKADAKE